MSIWVTQSSMPSQEEYIEEIRPIFEERRLTNMGPIYEKFRHQLMRYLNVPQLSLFVNGHIALEFILQALKLEGEVITTPYTFVSTTHAIVRSNLTPVFCDIKPEDYTIDPKKIEDLITDKTCAIVPVHVYGNLCDTEAIDAIAKKHNLKVIYDAAHAFGVTYKGVGVGNFGDASMFSFHATKVFNSIEGGAVAFQEEALSKSLHCLKNFGITGEDTIEAVGGNAKLDEFRAAMGICNLRHVEDEIAKREVVARRYYERLAGITGIKLLHVPREVKWNYAYFPVMFDGYKEDRDEVKAKLEAEDIYARKYFYPLVNKSACYEKIYGDIGVPVAAHAAESVLTLPMYAGLTIADVDRICDVIVN